MNSKLNSVVLKSKLALLGFAFLVPIQSQAGSATTTMIVSATVLTACTVAATALNFGNYDPTGGDVTATSTISVTCTGNSDYTLALNTGTGSGATFAERKLTAPGQFINYSIYTDNTHATVWGDGTSSTSMIPGTGSLVIASHTAHGKILAGQTANAGLYADVVTVSLSY